MHLWAQEVFNVTCLLLIWPVFLPSLLYGLSHPSLGDHRLGWAKSWHQDVTLQESSCRWMLPNISATCVCVPWVSHSCPIFPGDPPRSAGRSIPESCQITAFALGPGMCEILYSLFKSEFSISLGSVGFLLLSPVGFESCMLWGLIFSVLSPRAGEPDRGSELSPLWENLCDTIIHLLVENNCNCSPVYSPASYGVWLCLNSILPVHFLLVPLLSLVVGDLIWISYSYSYLLSVTDFFIDGYSAESCDFGVLVRAGEPRVFLLCHLDCSLPAVPCLDIWPMT